MTRKAIFLVLSFLLAVTLVASACSSPGTTTTTTKPTTATTTPIKTTSPTTTISSDKPQYGGTLTVLQAADITVFDPAAQGQLNGAASAWLVNEQFVTQDWTQGLAGSGKVDWYTAEQAMENYSPWLAESFTIREPGVTVFQVRRGVRYALNPNSEASRLVNGREMTADDWIENFNYMMTKPNTPYKSFEPKAFAGSKLEKTGPWEVTFTGKDDMLSAWHWISYGGGFHFVWPPEVAKKYGDNANWKNSVGTGPYMLTDFVPGSAERLS